MKQLTPEKVPIYFASEHGAARVPAWAHAWDAHAGPWEKLLLDAKMQAGILVLELESMSKLPTSPLWHAASEWVLNDHWSGHVVCQFEDQDKSNVSALTDALRQSPHLSARTEFTWSKSRLEESVTEAVAKHLLDLELTGGTNEHQFIELKHFKQPKQKSEMTELKQMIAALSAQLHTLTLSQLQLPASMCNPTPPSRDPLAEVKEVLAATADLHASSGRLSAALTAKVFGLPKANLAQIIGTTRQALNKTPDAESIQEALRPFERIARLRSVLSDEKFLAWLQRPNRQLEENTPLQLIKDGRAVIVADLVEDMLLGTPG